MIPNHQVCKLRSNYLLAFTVDLWTCIVFFERMYCRVVDMHSVFAYIYKAGLCTCMVYWLTSQPSARHGKASDHPNG